MFDAVAGALPAQSEGTDSGVARPIVLINGTADPLVQFGGGHVGPSRMRKISRIYELLVGPQND